MTPAGLKPAIPGSVGRCLIHWATGPVASIHSYIVWRTFPSKLVEGGSSQPGVHPPPELRFLNFAHIAQTIPRSTRGVWRDPGAHQQNSISLIPTASRERARIMHLLLTDLGMQHFTTGSRRHGGGSDWFGTSNAGSLTNA